MPMGITTRPASGQWKEARLKHTECPSPTPVNLIQIQKPLEENHG